MYFYRDNWNLQAKQDTEKARRIASEKLREDLEVMGSNMKREHRIYKSLPKDEEHQNMHLLGQVCIINEFVSICKAYLLCTLWYKSTNIVIGLIYLDYRFYESSEQRSERKTVWDGGTWGHKCFRNETPFESLCRYPVVPQCQQAVTYRHCILSIRCDNKETHLLSTTSPEVRVWYLRKHILGQEHLFCH